VQARLDAASRVQHPNLLIIRRSGIGRLDTESLVYAVMEPFDQSLAEILRERPLTPDETRDVAGSLLSALEAVEGAGLFHGHIDASGVLAVGDAIKLRSDCLAPRRADSDAPALAALIYHALTGRRFSSERDALQLPAPFATLVRAGSGSNGSLAAMRRVLSGAVTTAAPAAPASPSSASHAPAPVASSVVTSRASSGLDQDPVRRDAVQGTRSPRASLRDDPERLRRRPGVAIAAVLLMALLLVIFWFAFKRPAGHTPISGEAGGSAANASPQANQPSTATPAHPAANPAEQAAATMGAPETAMREPVPKRSAATPAPTTGSAPTPIERNVWHVVAYTYARQEAAQRKATELAAQYPQLQPQVFSPSGHAPYLVVLGGGMDRQGAFAQRDAARAAGMPADTYAQNFRK
jgi:hypothetical protein